jgi:hypothetical protein
VCLCVCVCVCLCVCVCVCVCVYTHAPESRTKDPFPGPWTVYLVVIFRNRFLKESIPHLMQIFFGCKDTWLLGSMVNPGSWIQGPGTAFVVNQVAQGMWAASLGNESASRNSNRLYQLVMVPPSQNRFFPDLSINKSWHTLPPVFQ